MGKQQKGLKKNSLDFLLSSTGLDEVLLSRPSVELSDIAAVSSTAAGIIDLPVTQIFPNLAQPRRYFDPAALQELANSIEQHGLMQPIVVRTKSHELGYEIVAGERRWRAVKMLGMDSISAVIKEVSDEAALVLAVVENIQRETLTPLETAQALQRLVDKFSLTQQQVADLVGRSRSAVANLLRLLQLNEAVQRLLEESKLEMGHARAVLSLPAELQECAANKIVDEKLTVRDAEKLVQKWSSMSNPNEANKEQPLDNKDSLLHKIGEQRFARINELASFFSSSVSAQVSRSGKGKLSIAYQSLQELDEILKKMDTLL